VARVIRGAARVVRASSAARASERDLALGLVELARERHALRETSAREIGTLALEVAARIVGERVETDPALLERMVLRAIERARADTAVRVLLHPADRLALDARLAARLPPEITLVDDETQARGGCLVRGTLVTVDARLESVLGAIAQAMGIDRPT
jgi:flagellar biosynthesis/type III secretory pathway protein FliH